MVLKRRQVCGGLFVFFVPLENRPFAREMAGATKIEAVVASSGSRYCDYSA
jgi:hypothetical protein